MIRARRCAASTPRAWTPCSSADSCSRSERAEAGIIPRVFDLSIVRPALEIDRAWSLYALADLTPEHSNKAEWYAPDDSGRCAVLVYRGFGRPIFLDSGDFGLVRQTIPELAGNDSFYLSVRAQTLALLEEAGYTVARPKRMLRMRLDRARFRPKDRGAAVRLSTADLPMLRALYADGEAQGEAPEFFLPAMLDTGVYFGAPAENGLAAVAGTHVFAPEEGVAGVGNIYTRRDARRRGLARQVTTAVLVDLVERGIDVICLNVTLENVAAADLYRSLGFEVHCEYFEGVATRSGSLGG